MENPFKLMNKLINVVSEVAAGTLFHVATWLFSQLAVAL